MDFAIVTPLDALDAVITQYVHVFYLSKTDDLKYREFFKARSDIGKYLILVVDTDTPTHAIVQIAEDIGVQELVFFSHSVESRISEFMLGAAIQSKSNDILRGLRIRIHLPLTGKDLWDWSKQTHKIVNAYNQVQRIYPKVFPFPPVLGVSQKFFASLSDDEDKEVCGRILEGYRKGARCELHLWEWDGDRDILHAARWRSVSCETQIEEPTAVKQLTKHINQMKKEELGE